MLQEKIARVFKAQLISEGILDSKARTSLLDSALVEDSFTVYGTENFELRLTDTAVIGCYGAGMVFVSVA